MQKGRVCSKNKHAGPIKIISSRLVKSHAADWKEIEEVYNG